MQGVRVYSHDGPIGRRTCTYILTADQSERTLSSSTLSVRRSDAPISTPNALPLFPPRSSRYTVDCTRFNALTTDGKGRVLDELEDSSKNYLKSRLTMGQGKGLAANLTADQHGQ
eukprot:9484386-Pyramimonas_sp.AAC.2